MFSQSSASGKTYVFLRSGHVYSRCNNLKCHIALIQHGGFPTESLHTKSASLVNSQLSHNHRFHTVRSRATPPRFRLCLSHFAPLFLLYALPYLFKYVSRVPVLPRGKKGAGRVKIAQKVRRC